jgi:LytS/YehU family sensor histidine kinase
LISENKIKQQGQYVKGLILLLFLAALISLLYIRHNKLRSDFVRLDLEQRALQSQMNPHFIFNSLCAVQDLIMGGKPQQANSFLAKVAKLMRNILENSREEFIPLEKEIETIKLYLDLQQLRFETNFDYSISLDDSIDTENISVPPMFMQPCVENSVEHGLLPRKEKGQLNILYKLCDGLMRVEITDNGIGRQLAAATEKRTKQSLSSTLTDQRLENFRKTLRKRDIGVETIDLYSEGDASGTKVVMMLPCKKIYE